MSTQVVSPAFVDAVRVALLGRSSVLASEIGLLVQETAKKQQLPILLRDLGGARSFVESHLSDLFVKDESADCFGPRLRFIAKDAVAAAQPLPTDKQPLAKLDEADEQPQLEGWSPATGRDRLFWDMFNNPLRNARFALTQSGCLYWIDSQAALPEGAQAIRPMTPDDYRQMAKFFADRSDDSIARNRMLHVLRESPERSFATDWFRLVGVLGQRSAWEKARIAEVIEAFRQRLTAAGADQAIVDKHTSELIKSKGEMVRHRPPSQLSKAKTFRPDERKSEVHLRNLLMDLAQILSNDEIRQLCIPLGKVIDALSLDAHPEEMDRPQKRIPVSTNKLM